MSIETSMGPCSVEGFEELNSALDELSKEITTGAMDRMWRDAMYYAMEPVLWDAKSFAPFDPNSKDGHIRDHIYLKAHKPQSKDRSSASYRGEMFIARVTASPIRDSSKLKTTLTQKGRFISRWTGLKPVGVSMEFGNAKTAAHPFMRPALEANLTKVQSRLATGLWSIIQYKFPDRF